MLERFWRRLTGAGPPAAPTPPPLPDRQIRLDIMRKLAEAAPGLGTPFRRLAPGYANAAALRDALTAMREAGQVDFAPPLGDDTRVRLGRDTTELERDLSDLSAATFVERMTALDEMRDARLAAQASPTPAPTPIPFILAPAATRRRRIVE